MRVAETRKEAAAVAEGRTGERGKWTPFWLLQGEEAEAVLSLPRAGVHNAFQAFSSLTDKAA